MHFSNFDITIAFDNPINFRILLTRTHEIQIGLELLFRKYKKEIFKRVFQSIIFFFFDILNVLKLIFS